MAGSDNTHLCMKVLYIDPQSIYNLAQYDCNLLSNINAEITYCCNVKYDAKILDKVNYEYVFRYSKYSLRVLKALSYVISIFKIMLIVRKVRPDVIHIQWWRLWFIDYAVLSYFRKYSGSVVFTAHNVMPHDSGIAYKKRCTKYYNKVDKLIVHVERTKEQLVKEFAIPPEKIFVVPHGLLRANVDHTLVTKYHMELENKWKVQNRIVFSCIGYQSHYKGTDIIKSILENSSLLQNNPKVLFIVAGKGNIFTPETMRSYNNLLVMNNFIPTEQLEAIMNITNVQLLPYRVISQSGVLLSTIEKEIPYIATDVGGLLDPIHIAPIGWSIPLNSVEAFSSLLEFLVQNPEEILRKRNNRIGWESVKQYYDWEDIGKKTMECYMHVL